MTMLGLTALELARIQFGFTISFHIVFPAITIRLASYLTVLKACWLRTRDETYRNLYHFWSKIFAVSCGMGVVSGLVMAYQFGTNWSFFSDFAGSVTGPLLAYEVSGWPLIVVLVLTMATAFAALMASLAKATDLLYTAEHLDSRLQRLLCQACAALDRCLQPGGPM